MNILYIAFSCSPYHGSEDKIGWNIPVESAKTNRVFVITREDQRQYIERYLREKPLSNIQFIYVDVPHFLQRMLSKAPYTLMLNMFHQYAYRIAKELCAAEHIEVIHQITPVEFRSIGNYGKIPNVKFVCGPIAGGQAIPKQLVGYLGFYSLTEMVRLCVNALFRLWILLFRKFKDCDYLLLANHETSHFLRSCIPNNVEKQILTDVAIDEVKGVEAEKREAIVRFSVVGRLVYLKGHRLLFDALRRIPNNLQYECIIVGGGREERRLIKFVRQYGLESRVRFIGSVPYTEISEVYGTTDVLIMPSFREATGSVILEAMAHGVPVITINRFGGATILDDDTGWLYDGNTKEEFIENLKNAIVACIDNPGEVTRKGINAQKRAEEYTWEEKMRKYQAIYDSLVAIE